MMFDMWVMSHTCTSSILLLVDKEDVSGGTPFAIPGVAQIGGSMDFTPDILKLAQGELSFPQWPFFLMIQ